MRVSIQTELSSVRIELTSSKEDSTFIHVVQRVSIQVESGDKAEVCIYCFHPLYDLRTAYRFLIHRIRPNKVACQLFI